MTQPATLAYTSSREEAARLAIARIAAGGRLTDAAQRERRIREQAWNVAHRTGQLVSDEDGYWCYICGRPTDHTGEHTPEQIAAWRENRRW